MPPAPRAEAALMADVHQAGCCTTDSHCENLAESRRIPPGACSTEDVPIAPPVDAASEGPASRQGWPAQAGSTTRGATANHADLHTVHKSAEQLRQHSAQSCPWQGARSPMIHASQRSPPEYRERRAAACCLQESTVTGRHSAGAGGSRRTGPNGAWRQPAPPFHERYSSRTGVRGAARSPQRRQRRGWHRWWRQNGLLVCRSGCGLPHLALRVLRKRPGHVQEVVKPNVSKPAGCCPQTIQDESIKRHA